MSIAEQFDTPFADPTRMGSNYKYYLLELQRSIVALATRVNRHCLSVETGQNTNIGIYQHGDKDYVSYEAAIGKASDLNVFDYLTLLLSYVISRAPLTGTNAKWLRDSGIPHALVDAASAITLAPGVSNPMTMIDRILENPHSINAALRLFGVKSKLSWFHEVTPESVHTAKQYVELIGTILSSNVFKGVRANWGPMKLEKLNALMPPNAGAELSKGQFFVRLQEVEHSVVARVYVTGFDAVKEHVVNIIHKIKRHSGQVETIVNTNFSVYADAIFTGADFMVENFGHIDEDRAAAIARQIHVRYGRFKETV